MVRDSSGKMEIAIRLDELIFTQQEIEKEGVDRVVEKVENKEGFGPITGRYCRHSKRYFVIDGHHTAYALYYHFNVKEIIFRYDDCSKSDTHKLDLEDPCIIREDYYVFNGSIHDLKDVDYGSARFRFKIYISELREMFSDVLHKSCHLR